MTASESLAWALRHVAHGLKIFPVRADKRPLVSHWREDATTDSAAIETWLQKWPHCEFGWALPADVVVVDVDVKHGKDGYADFKRLEGCDAKDVATPQATTTSGGLHVIYRAAKVYSNLVSKVAGGIDTRAEGGFILLPVPGNGREWLRPLLTPEGMCPLLPAPAWLDRALKQTPRAPLTLAPRSALAQPTSDSWAQKKALAMLEQACARIVAAPCGEQDSTRHAQCFYVGGLIARGDLDYAAAHAALIAAARAMPAYRDAWRGLEERVARSLESGMAQPLILSTAEVWMREFRARMAGRRPAASGGARHG